MRATVLCNDIKVFGYAKVQHAESGPRIITDKLSPKTRLQEPDGHDVYFAVGDRHEEVPLWLILSDLDEYYLFDSILKHSDGGKIIAARWIYVRSLLNKEKMLKRYINSIIQKFVVNEDED